MKPSKSNIVLSVIIAVLLLVISVMLCRDFSKKSDNGTDASVLFAAESENRDDSKLQNYPFAIELDQEYERRLSAAQSNAEMTDIHTEFAEKWKAEIDVNYQKLLTVANGDFKEALIASQAEWYVNAEKDLDEKYFYFESVHDVGSVTPVVSSKYACDLYRERAIELFVMYGKVTKSE